MKQNKNVKNRIQRTFGNFWQMLVRQLFATIGNFWQPLENVGTYGKCW